MGSVLFLDDRDIRVQTFLKTHPDAVLARSAKECIEKLSSQSWDEVWLDHDLNCQPHVPPDERAFNNGMSVVRWIINNTPRVGRFVIHSTNVEWTPVMAQLLQTHGYYTHCQQMQN